MASALYTDVKRKQGASVFTRPQVTSPADSCSSPAQQQGQQQNTAGGDGVLASACRRASLGCGSGMQRALCQTTICWWMWRWGTSHPLSRGSGRALAQVLLLWESASLLQLMASTARRRCSGSVVMSRGAAGSALAHCQLILWPSRQPKAHTDTRAAGHQAAA